MRVICDSHVLVWWLADPELLSAKAREILRDPENEVYFSAASIWELGLKVAKGKLTLPAGYVSVLKGDGFEELHVTSADAEKATELPAIHGDPFDRMLVAQTLLSGSVLLTRDDAVLSYPVPHIKA